MQLSYLLVVGLLSELPAAAELPLPRAEHCNCSVAPNTGDTCESFAKTWGLSVAQFQALNPDAQCPNLDPNKNYCVIGTVTPSAGTTTSTAMSTSTALTASTTTMPPAFPTPTLPGVASNCDKFHKVSSHDTCNTVEQQYGISDSQFRQWNGINDPEDDVGLTGAVTGCTKLWLDYYVCVHVPGATTMPPPQVPPPERLMPGVVTNCTSYYKVSGEAFTCYDIERKFHVTLDQLRSWDTQLNEDCTNLWMGYYICVGV
ncbi:hypothetical protein C8A03DRAFT_19454 [Achaetomium macrosporum]|uniref:LysM domain-containing protein n=1 Tax=Achaetomium macrosporum TaxID=79813 RepID=A0AAN7C1A1_9PEZI|nr:hypothetical protein C8A03DRAFT_19454 [Achaetomium macrosporum]